MNNEKMKALRQKKGYTQEGLAEKVGITRSHYNQIENGKLKPSFKVLEQIAVVLNCSMRDFF